SAQPRSTRSRQLPVFLSSLARAGGSQPLVLPATHGQRDPAGSATTLSMCSRRVRDGLSGRVDLLLATAPQLTAHPGARQPQTTGPVITSGFFVSWWVEISRSFTGVPAYPTPQMEPTSSRQARRRGRSTQTSRLRIS